MGDVKNEFKRIGFHSPEKPPGSKDTQNYGEYTSKPRGRPRKRLQVDDGTGDTSRPVGIPSKYTKTDDNSWKNKKPQTTVNEFNTVACENIEINKVGKKNQKHMRAMAM